MDEFYRSERAGAGRQLLDLLCVALLGLILTLAAGASARVPAAAAAPGHAGHDHGKAAADCDTPAKPDPLASALPGAAAVAPCADGEKPAAPTTAH